jgi:hypothetical protein
MSNLGVEKGIFGDAEVPKNGVIITLDDEKLGYWQIGDLRKSTEVAGLALYRLISYFNGNGDKISKAVDGIVGRIN